MACGSSAIAWRSEDIAKCSFGAGDGRGGESPGAGDRRPGRAGGARDHFHRCAGQDVEATSIELDEIEAKIF